MANDIVQRLNPTLSDVMGRFRNFFLGPGANLREEHVPFRRRPDFESPLVTVLGHTYGVRLVLDEGERGTKSPNVAVEVSVNVYDDEFRLERFKERITEAYKPSELGKTIDNFMTPDDPDQVKTQREDFFTSVVSFQFDHDIELVSKEKTKASEVTGRFVDTILRMRYWLRPAEVNHLAEDRKLFLATVYLYCLRPFAAAYHKSLTT